MLFRCLIRVSYAFTISLSLHLTSSHFVTTGAECFRFFAHFGMRFPAANYMGRGGQDGPASMQHWTSLNHFQLRHQASFLAPGQVAGITFVIREITIDKVGSTSCFTTGNEKVQLCQHQWEGPYSFNLSKWHNTVHTVEGQQTPFDT